MVAAWRTITTSPRYIVVMSDRPIHSTKMICWSNRFPDNVQNAWQAPPALWQDPSAYRIIERIVTNDRFINHFDSVFSCSLHPLYTTKHFRLDIRCDSALYWLDLIDISALDKAYNIIWLNISSEHKIDLVWKRTLWQFSPPWFSQICTQFAI